MKPESINQISLPEAMELLDSINFDPAWTGEQFVVAIAHFPDRQITSILAALNVVATASSAEAHKLRTAAASRHSPTTTVSPLKSLTMKDKIS